MTTTIAIETPIMEFLFTLAFATRSSALASCSSVGLLFSIIAVVSWFFVIGRRRERLLTCKNNTLRAIAKM